MMFQIAEWLSTFIENLVVLSAVTQMAHPKNHGKKNLVYLWGFSFFMMLIILLLNQIQVFSFVTIAFGFACAIFLTRFTAQKDFYTGSQPRSLHISVFTQRIIS